MVLRNAESTHATGQRHFKQGFDLQRHDADYLCLCLFDTRLTLRHTSSQCLFYSNKSLILEIQGPRGTFSADSSSNLNTDFVFLELGKPSVPRGSP